MLRRLIVPQGHHASFELRGVKFHGDQGEERNNIMLIALNHNLETNTRMIFVLGKHNKTESIRDSKREILKTHWEYRSLSELKEAERKEIMTAFEKTFSAGAKKGTKILVLTEENLLNALKGSKSSMAGLVLQDIKEQQ